jgi:hypothetical protein
LSSINIGDEMTTASPINNRKRYAGFADTATYAGYSTSHFRALVREGKFPKPIRPYGPGGKCIFDLDVVDAHMRALAVEQGVIPPNAA